MDIRTLFIANICAGLLLSFIIYLLGRKHFSRPLTLGSLSLGLISAGLLILASRDSIGVSVSSLLGNGIISVGFALLSETLLSFQRRSLSRAVIWLPVAAMLLIITLFTDDVSMRIAVSSSIYALQTLIVTFITYSGRKQTSGWGWQLIVAATFFYFVSFAIRSVASFGSRTGILDIFSQGWVQSQAFLASLLALICVAIGIMAIYAGQVEEQVRQSEEKNRSIIEHANDVIYVISPDGRIEFMSKRSKEIIGHDASDLIGTEFSALVHPEDKSACLAEFDQIVSKKSEIVHLQYRVKTSGGQWVWHETNAGPILDAEGAISGVLGIGRDVSDRKLQEAELQRRAYYDPLTALPNRALIVDRADQSIRLAKRDERKSALLFLDLDGFKSINDEHGHAVGDAVLKEVAQRLQLTIRGSDSVGRLGGDEFLVVLQSFLGMDDAISAAKRIEDALSVPLIVGEMQLPVRCSIGIACFPEHGEDLDSLLGKADVAMYGAKRASTGWQLATLQ
ncbi:diguanylate cyclase [Tabrizicola sp.]|uniref:diguanylate cyclase n=1 Tax=Tabrizicola sp. TaxID=2005166 RepID=UPI003D2BFE07